MKDEIVMKILIGVVECLIEEIEGQGKTTVTTGELRQFIHNMEGGHTVKGKKYSHDIGR